MILALAIGIPVFLIFGGALLALAFAGPGEQPEHLATVDPPSSQPQMFFMQPSQGAASARKLSIEELIDAVTVKESGTGQVSHVFSQCQRRNLNSVEPMRMRSPLLSTAALVRIPFTYVPPVLPIS